MNNLCFGAANPANAQAKNENYGEDGKLVYEKDGFIPPSMMPVLYNNAACPKAFLWIPGADHVEGIDIDPGTYWKGVEKFLSGVDPAILKGED